MPRVLGCSLGGGCFIMGEVPLYVGVALLTALRLSLREGASRGLLHLGWLSSTQGYLA